MNSRIYSTVYLLLFSASLTFSQTNKLAFIQNKGQWDPEIYYRTDFPGGQALATNTGMLVGLFDTVSLMERVDWGNKIEDHFTGTQYFEAHPTPPPLKGHGWKFHFLNGNPLPLMENKNESGDFYNFWVGDPSQHASHVRSYEEITYKNVYNDIDVKYYTSLEGFLENDIIVKPFADASSLELEIEGIDQIQQDNNGHLILSTSVGDVTVPSPVSYLLDNNGAHTPISVTYILEHNSNGQTIRFSIPNYDNSKTLVIDPVVVRWATWATNASSADTHNHGTGLDSLGNIYVTGRINSTGLITAGAFQSTSGGGMDVFVGKYTEPSAAGSSGTRVWQTYIGGSGTDNNIALQMGIGGYIYIAANSTSDLPKTFGTGFTAGGWTQRTSSGGTLTQPTLIKLDLAGNGASVREMGTTSTNYAFQSADLRIVKTGIYTYDLVYSGYFTFPKNFGSADGDFPAPTLPNGSTYTSPNGGTAKLNAMIMRITNDFSTISWVKNIGSDASSNKDDAVTITAVDLSGNIYAAGYTTATANISYNNTSTQTSLVGSQDGWIMKLNSSGTVQWSRYFNSSSGNSTSILSMELNRIDTNLIIAGITGGLATANITAGVVQGTYGGGTNDLFIAKISKTGLMTNWGTYYGGSGTETNMMGLNTDQNDDIYFLGYTSSTNYPTSSNPIQSTNFGSNDAVFTKLNSSVTATYYSTYYGGAADDNDPLGQRGILFNNCRAYLSVTANSNDIPLTSGTLTSTKSSATSVPEPVIVTMANPPDLGNSTISTSQIISCAVAPVTLSCGASTYNVPAVIRNNVSQTNGTSGAYPAGIPTPTSYQWQKSIDYTYTWTDIPGATSLNYSPPVLYQTTYYRRIVNGDYCTIADSNVSVTMVGSPNVSPSVTCAASTISFFANPSGGAGSNTFSWTGPSFTSTLQDPQITSASSANNGLYSVTVTDVNGCKNTRAMFIDFTSCTYSVVLSVAMINFNAVKDGTTSKLTWQTASEKSSDYFDVERSSDGKHWENIGKVDAHGTSVMMNYYSFIDKNPFEGINYYRLRIVDLGGQFKYSEIKTLRFDQLNVINIVNAIPNPFRNKVNVDYSASANNKVMIKITDALGHDMERREMISSKGMNSVEFNTENYASGIYFISISNEGTLCNYKMMMKK